MNKYVAKLIARLQKPEVELASLVSDIADQEKALREQWHEINRVLSEQFTALNYRPQGAVTVNTGDEDNLCVLTFVDTDLVLAPAEREEGLFGSYLEYDLSQAKSIDQASLCSLTYATPKIPELLRQALKHMKREVWQQKNALWASKGAVAEAKRILSRLT